MWGKDKRGPAAASINIGAAVLRCWVRAASQKTGSLLKMKLIGRRTPEEGRFLNDLVCWVTHSQVTETDRLFSRYIQLKCGRRSKKELSARMIRDQIKETCVIEDLPAEHFSESFTPQSCDHPHEGTWGIGGGHEGQRGLLSRIKGNGEYV